MSPPRKSPLKLSARCHHAQFLALVHGVNMTNATRRFPMNAQVDISVAVVHELRPTALPNRPSMVVRSVPMRMATKSPRCAAMSLAQSIARAISPSGVIAALLVEVEVSPGNTLSMWPHSMADANVINLLMLSIGCATRILARSIVLANGASGPSATRHALIAATMEKLVRLQRLIRS